MNNNRKKKTQTQTPGEERLKCFLDMIAPSVIQFYTDHYICGNTFRSVWALREYPTATDEQAILRHLGEKDGVTLRIYTRKLHLAAAFGLHFAVDFLTVICAAAIPTWALELGLLLVVAVICVAVYKLVYVQMAEKKA